MTPGIHTEQTLDTLAVRRSFRQARPGEGGGTCAANRAVTRDEIELDPERGEFATCSGHSVADRGELDPDRGESDTYRGESDTYRGESDTYRGESTVELRGAQPHPAEVPWLETAIAAQRGLFDDEREGA